MEPTPARRVRVYVREDQHRHGRPLYRAVVELLRSEGARGATVFRGLEGFGASGRLHTSSLVDDGATSCSARSLINPTPTRCQPRVMPPLRTMSNWSFLGIRFSVCCSATCW